MQIHTHYVVANEMRTVSAFPLNFVNIGVSDSISKWAVISSRSSESSLINIGSWLSDDATLKNPCYSFTLYEIPYRISNEGVGETLLKNVYYFSYQVINNVTTEIRSKRCGVLGLRHIFLLLNGFLISIRHIFMFYVWGRKVFLFSIVFSFRFLYLSEIILFKCGK